jgi:hypothetical protein
LGDGTKVRSVQLVGSDANVTFDQRDDALYIQLPQQSTGKYAYAFRILLN